MSGNNPKRLNGSLCHNNCQFFGIFIFIIFFEICVDLKTKLFVDNEECVIRAETICYLAIYIQVITYTSYSTAIKLRSELSRLGDLKLRSQSSGLEYFGNPLLGIKRTLCNRSLYFREFCVIVLLEIYILFLFNLCGELLEI